MVSHFKNIVKAVVNNPRIKLKDIDIIPEAEKNLLLYEWNDTAAAYPADKTIHELFEEQAGKSPDSTAVIGRGQTAEDRRQRTDEITITYRRLNEKSDQLAGVFQEKGVTPGTTVAIMMERSVDMIAAILGILKAGGAYLPIDPDYPQERIDYMLADSGAKILLTELPEGHKLHHSSNQFIIHHSSNLAYIIYTSGSTGKPRGVMVDHRSVVSYLCWAAGQYVGGERVNFPLFTSISFDLTVTSLFTPLITGNSVIVYGGGNDSHLIDILGGIFRDERIGAVKLTPSHLKIAVAMDMDSPCYIRRFILGGEELEGKLAGDTVKKFGNGIEIYNEYGPTEAAVGCMIYLFDPLSDRDSSVPIGVPAANVQLYILDRTLNILPVGLPGELYISGAGIARGYLNQPELTAEKFCLRRAGAPPFDEINKSFCGGPGGSFFKKRPLAVGDKLYKTGDLVRWHPDGNMQFLGRIDDQVKIRGFRIELGEIQRRLSAHEAVKEAVVLDRENQEGERFLCAYIVASPGAAVDAGALRGYLSGILPGYMIPGHFILLEKFPVNINGKVDIRALPAPRQAAVPAGPAVPGARGSETVIADLWKEVLGIPRVDPEDNYFERGGNSLNIIQLNRRLKEAFAVDIPLARMFRYTTIRSQAEYIGRVKGDRAGMAGIGGVSRGSFEEVAIIGMAGRFPGAANIVEFKENLANGVESISFFSEAELREAGVEPGVYEGPKYVKAHGMLEGADCFDAAFFGYIPAEAAVMDPQMRLFHQCCWEALENAGYNPYTYGESIGLYTGASPNIEWEAITILSGRSRDLGNYAASQLTGRDYLATRVSYKLNLKGPALLVQAACSTSLVSVEEASRDLQAGKCSLALAGGVCIRGFRESGYLYEEGMINSPDGHCRTFDRGAGGTVSGDGAGVVVLKLLRHALADGDHIEAVIKGTFVNNDGVRKPGYTAPSVEGQAEVIRAAMQTAGVEAETIRYIETHGTGTPLGDPVEIEALRLAFAGAGKHSCALGSVKSNIGHLDAAAGAAGLIKTILFLKHGMIPPSLHFETPNPGIDFENSPFYVSTGLHPWPRSRHPRRAGVSSFGIGGTNVHVILEEAPAEIRDKEGTRGLGPLLNAETSKKYHLILLSAQTQSALAKITENLAGYLKENPGINLADAAYTLQVGRKAFKYRRMKVCSHIGEAIEAFSPPASKRLQTFMPAAGTRLLIFMFPGQGSQYVDMGGELYEREPVFREAIDRCIEILKPLTNYNIKEILYPNLVSEVSEVSGVNRSNRSYTSYKSHKSYINRTEIAQPAIFIFEYALAMLLMKWGIRPGAMIGHSIGEYTAAHLAGVFSLEEALRLVALRGRLMQQMPAGGMMGVRLPEAEVMPLLSGDLSLAAVNAPSHCVVSGPHRQLEAFVGKLREKGCEHRSLHTSHAFHSNMMDPILKEFEKAVAGITLRPPAIPYISNVTGDWITAEQAVDPGYWSTHLRQTVRFAGGVRELLKKEHGIFIEVGPGKTLGTFVRQNNDGGAAASRLVVNLVRHPKEEIPDRCLLLERIGRLWLYGAAPDWSGFYRGERRRRISLPAYPFEKQRFSTAGDPYKMLACAAAAPAEAAGGIYIPRWQPELIKTSTKINIKTGTVLVFHHPRGIGSLLAERLKKDGHTVISVTPGREFENKEKNAYTVNPGNKGDYLELMTAIANAAVIPGRILHLWGTGGDCPGEPAVDQTAYHLEQGFYSLLYLARAIGRTGIKGSFRLVHIAGGMHCVTGLEELEPLKAAVLGPLKVIPQEFPNIRCRSIDIMLPPAGSPGEGVLAGQLLQEIASDSPDTITALRGNQRWTRHFERIKSEQGEAPLRERGIYLVTGGLGNIGLQLAYYLARDYHARLVLTGRTPMPPRPRWEQAPVSRKVEALLAVEKEASGLLTAAVDAADFNGMQKLLQQVEDQWGPVNGVIHAAGAVDPDAFTAVRDTEEDVCRRHFRPKIDGLMVLEKVLSGKELDFCWVMSSVSAVLGGLGFAAYAAANIFMDAFVYRHNQTPSPRWLGVDWDHPEGEDLWQTFRRILSLDGVQQAAVSSNGGLGERIDRWIKLRSPGGSADTAGTGAEERDAGDEKERPQLSTAYVPPGTPQQTRLARLWQNFFKYRDIGIEDDFFELGGDSLKAVTLIALIHKESNKEIPIAEFFKYPTIRQQAAYLDGPSESRKYLAVPAVEKKEYYPLSSAQKRLYVLQQMEPGSTGYNIPQAAVLEGKLDREKSASVFKRLLARHEVLRTSFHMVEDEPVQKVHDTVDSGQWTLDSRGEPLCSPTGRKTIAGNGEEKIIKDFIRPFDLSKAPLLRVGLTEIAEQRHILMLDLHHIVTDGVSYEIFTRELMALYHDEALPPLRIQYKDYAEWQGGEAEKKRIEKQRDYWLAEYPGDIPVLELPTDFARPARQSFAGKQVNTRLDEDITGDLKRMASANDTTLFMVLLSIYTLLLAKLSGQEDIVVGTPTAGREHADLRPVFGMFVNTLALRNRPAGEKIFADFLKEVKERTLTSFANQEYLFEDLVEEVEIERDAGRNPLFDIMFSLMNVDIPEIQVPGLKLKPYPHDPGISKFDMMLYCSETRDGLSLLFEYCTRLFKHETMERFAGYFKTLVFAVLDNPRQKIKDIEIISPGERKQLLYDFNDTRADYPKEKTIHELFAEQAGRTPDGVAVVDSRQYVVGSKKNDGQTAITYRELNNKSDQLARVLKEKGVTFDTIAAIMMERSLEMIAGILGILKAGGAYLPIDPDYPQERINYILSDSGVKVLIKKSEIRISKSEINPNDPNSNDQNKRAEVTVLDFEHLNFEFVSNFEFRASNLSSSELAYIIYTSGTTGKPKGTLIEHKNVVRLLFNDKFSNLFTFSPHDTWTLFHSFCFDFSVWEMYGALLYGGKLIIVSKTAARDTDRFLDILETGNVTVLNQTPSAFYNLIAAAGEERKLYTRYIVFGGEALNPLRLEKWAKKYPHTKLINMYGITETTVHVTYKEIAGTDMQSDISNIGKPIPTLSTYVMDRSLRILPLGVAGELCVGGEGAARGYLNRPGLTAEKFVQNPYIGGEKLYRSGDLVIWNTWAG
jgi:amino acid adenylation domain-containing protein